MTHDRQLMTMQEHINGLRMTMQEHVNGLREFETLLRKRKNREDKARKLLVFQSTTPSKDLAEALMGSASNRRP